MFNQGGLSLDQAPPISVVLRFFVSGAVFGILTGVAMLYFGTQTLTPESTAARVTTHLLALGVMASFMLGALFQMLPVIAGVVLQNPIRKATFVHIAFLAGVLSLVGAFLTNHTFLYTAAAILLASALLYASLIMIINLFNLQNHSSSSKGMLFALIAFTLTLIAALYLLTTLAGGMEGTYYLQIKEAHYSFALFGWVALLIVSISFQVVEMFYVTPAYPKIISNYFTATILTLLLLKVFGIFQGFAHYIDLLIAVLFILYAAVTIHRLYKRKRPTSDATVWFWRLGMGLLIVTMLLLIAQNFTSNATVKQLAYGTFTLFALSIVFAMVYKIVPFLAWFHLSNQGYMKAPLMHDIIHPKRIKVHFYLHSALLVTFLFSFVIPALFYLCGILTLISFGWLLYHLGYAIYIYRHTQKHSEKISW